MLYHVHLVKLLSKINGFPHYGILGYAITPTCLLALLAPLGDLTMLMEPGLSSANRINMKKFLMRAETSHELPTNMFHIAHGFLHRWIAYIIT
jgi:hypothetical protein